MIGNITLLEQWLRWGSVSTEIGGLCKSRMTGSECRTIGLVMQGSGQSIDRKEMKREEEDAS